MQHESPIPYERRRRVEATVFALVLAEDWPWRADELAERLHMPEYMIGLATATLRADGLVVQHANGLRALWTAVRGDELAGWGASIKRRACVSGPEGAIPLH